MQHPQRSQLAKRWQLDPTQNLFSGINLPSTGKTAPRGNPLISLYNQKTARGNIAGAVFQWKERRNGTGVCHMSAMTGSYLTWHEKYRIGHTESGQIGQTEPNRLNRTKSGRIGRKRGNRGRFARARWDGFSRSAGQTGGQPINQSANQTENHSTSDRASMM